MLTRRTMIITAGAAALTGCGSETTDLSRAERVVYDMVVEIFGKDMASHETYAAFARDFAASYQRRTSREAQFLFLHGHGILRTLAPAVSLFGFKRLELGLYQFRAKLATDFINHTTMFQTEPGEQIDYHGRSKTGPLSCRNKLARFDFDD